MDSDTEPSSDITGDDKPAPAFYKAMPKPKPKSSSSVVAAPELGSSMESEVITLQGPVVQVKEDADNSTVGADPRSPTFSEGAAGLVQDLTSFMEVDEAQPSEEVHSGPPLAGPHLTFFCLAALAAGGPLAVDLVAPPEEPFGLPAPDASMEVEEIQPFEDVQTGPPLVEPPEADDGPASQGYCFCIMNLTRMHHDF